MRPTRPAGLLNHSFSAVSLLLFTLTLPSPALAQTFTKGPISHSDQEWKRSDQLGKIKVDEAWKKGATGAGVTVAVIDSGVNSQHPDLKGRVLPGYNALNGKAFTPSARDEIGHGTHVAGIIAAGANGFGALGVAPRATILPVSIAEWDGTVDTAALGRGLRWAADRAPIINASLAGPKIAEGAVRYAVDKGALLVAAAANYDGANPLYPARYAKEAWAKRRIIVVGAVDKYGNLWSDSNRAGDTRQFFVVAPGVSISSTEGSGYAIRTGTSQATPVVSGVAALIKSYWPKLKAEEIASIIFRTATDLGKPGVDEVYGWGMVNAERALRPVGAVKLSSQGGQQARLGALGLKAPAAAGVALKRQSLSAIAHDEFARGFQYDLSGAVTTEASPVLMSALHDAGRQSGVVEQVLSDGSRYTAVVHQPTRLHASAGADTPSGASLGGFSWVMRTAQGTEWAVGAQGFAHDFFGAASELAPTRGDTAGINPMFQLVPGHSHLGYAAGIGEGWKLKTGVLTTALSDRFGDIQNEPTRTLKSSLMLGSLTKTIDSAAVSLSVGQLAETDALLGSRNGEGLRIEGSPNTRFAALEGAWQMSRNWAAYANFTVALTAAHRNSANSLIAGNTALRADAYTLGLVRADAWKKGDRVGLQVSQPLRFNQGGMDFALPQAEDEAGTVQFGEQRASLTPAGRELRAQVQYDAPVSKHSRISGVMMLRNQPGHDASAPADLGVGLRWSAAF